MGSLFLAAKSFAAGEARPRIVSLDDFFTEMLVAMQRLPVAITMRNGTPPAHLANLLKDVQSVGLHSAPDFERIVAVKPDLILAQATRFANEAPLLRAIAPTILRDEPAGDWRPFYQEFGETLGTSATTAGAIAAYDDKVRALRGRLSEELRRRTVLLLRIRNRDIRLYGRSRRAGQLLYRDLGLKPHRLTPADQPHVAVSLEVIPQLDADIIFVMVEDESRMSRIESLPLWRDLPAVRGGDVHRADIAWWNQTTGPIGGSRILGDVAAAFGVSP